MPKPHSCSLIPIPPLNCIEITLKVFYGIFIMQHYSEHSLSRSYHVQRATGTSRVGYQYVKRIRKFEEVPVILQG